MSKEAMKLALDALENSIDLVSKEARNAEELYGKYPTRLARIQGLVAFEVAHEKAITALKALAEQPEHHDPIGDAQDRLIAEQAAQKRPQNCGTGYCSCIECLMEPAQQERKPLDLAAAIEYADARWAGVDVPVEWCRHFADALQPAPVQQEPEIVQRVKRYAGKTLRTARNPNITARECIELADWLTTPPAQRTWVGLTEQEALDCFRPNPVTHSKNVEAKLKNT